MPLPLSNPRPDIERFLRALGGCEAPARPPLIEYLVDPMVMRPIVANMLGRHWVDPAAGDRESWWAYLDNFVAFWYRLGYDFVRLELSLPFARERLAAPDPAPGSTATRQWANQHRGMIGSWEDFERYAWPRIEDFDFSPFEYASAHLPDGMGLIVSHGGGVYEHLSDLFSYEGLCLALYDQPQLVQAVADRVGELMLSFYGQLVGLDGLAVIFPGDDMGFRTSTLVNPAALRRYVLPWHARYARLAHEHGRLYFIHSCGNVSPILPDLVASVGIDGKHSFEDAVLPAEEFHSRYSRGQERPIATLGGVDVDILARRTPDEVRSRVRDLIEACAPYGRFAIGSGNSIPSYVPVANYLAMIEEALR